MSIIDTLKALLSSKDAPPIPVTEHPAIPAQTAVELVNAYEAITGGRAFTDLERKHESEFYALRQEQEKRCVALLKAVFGGIPDEFRGTYRTVPGLFTASLCVFDASRSVFVEKKVPLFRMDLTFVPLLWGGIVIKDEWYNRLYLHDHNIGDIAVWPEDQPWPGTKVVGSYSGLKEQP